MLSLLPIRPAGAAVDGPYHDPGIIALGIALAAPVGRLARRVAWVYRKGARLQAMSSASCPPHMHG